MTLLSKILYLCAGLVSLSIIVFIILYLAYSTANYINKKDEQNKH
jgi:hypothetical protein